MKQNAQVMPMISVDSVDQARTFYVDKLGFGHMMGMQRRPAPVLHRHDGGAKIMLSRPNEKMEGTDVSTSRRPVAIYLEVSDVNAYHDQVKKRGVKITDPLTDQWWGDRTFTVMDPFGYA